MAFRGFDIDNQFSKKKKLQPHPSEYTDFDNTDESPWMHENKKPWYSWLEGKANEVTDSVSEGYDKMIQEAGDAYEYNSEDIDADSFGDPYGTQAEQDSIDNAFDKEYNKISGPDGIPRSEKMGNEYGKLQTRIEKTKRLMGKPNYYPNNIGNKTYNADEDVAGLNALDRMETEQGFLGPDRKERPGKRVDESDYSYLDEKLGPDSHDGGGKSVDETSWWDGISDSMESDGKPLSPMQKFAGKMIMDQFSEKQETPMATIGASPLTAGRQFDMSYLKSRPKKERYSANQGLLGR